jgi:hypothetical protein
MFGIQRFSKYFQGIGALLAAVIGTHAWADCDLTLHASNPAPIIKVEGTRETDERMLSMVREIGMNPGEDLLKDGRKLSGDSRLQANLILLAPAYVPFLAWFQAAPETVARKKLCELQERADRDANSLSALSLDFLENWNPFALVESGTYPTNYHRADDVEYARRELSEIARRGQIEVRAGDLGFARILRVVKGSLLEYRVYERKWVEADLTKSKIAVPSSELGVTKVLLLNN